MILWFIVDNLECIANSQLKSVIQVNDHASSRASADRWLAEVPASAALAPMHEECPPPAHLLRFLGVKVKSAGPCNGGVVHRILAVAKFILGGGEGAGVAHTLFLGVHVSRALAGVAVGVHVPVATSSDEVARVLVVGVGLGWSGGEGLAALSQTRTLMIVCWGHFQELGRGADY